MTGAVLVDVKAVVDAFVPTVVQTVVQEDVLGLAKVVVWDRAKVIAMVAAVDIATNLTKQTGRSWQAGLSKKITFIDTKDCQLACKYCYLVGKNTQERMP